MSYIAWFRYKIFLDKKERTHTHKTTTTLAGTQTNIQAALKQLEKSDNVAVQESVVGHYPRLSVRNYRKGIW